MDKTDLRIWRSMYPGGYFDPFAFDPRVKASAIAAHLGLSKGAVSSRIRHWRDEGFLTGFEIWPNLRLLGAGAMEVILMLEDVRLKATLFENVGLIDGVFMVWEGSGVETDVPSTHVVIWVVDEAKGTVGRRIELLRRLAPEGKILTRPINFPTAGGEPSSLDWRMIRALRREPESTLLSIARELRITPKTMTKRFDRLLDTRQIFYFPIMNLTKLPIVELEVRLVNLQSRGQVAAGMKKVSPDYFPMDTGYEPAAHPQSIFGMFPVETPGQVEGLATSILSIPNVAKVETSYPYRWRTFGEWIDRTLETRLR
jgi:DNA-binding Lrp family transcriptional regulator